jgi:hypothetical protein
VKRFRNDCTASMKRNQSVCFLAANSSLSFPFHCFRNVLLFFVLLLPLYHLLLLFTTLRSSSPSSPTTLSHSPPLHIPNNKKQAAVRVIREMAVGALQSKKRRMYFVYREFLMALALSIIVGVFGFIRASLFTTSISTSEAIAISTVLTFIVYISIVVGSMLPLLYQTMGLDPAHSSTTIQVISNLLILANRLSL